METEEGPYRIFSTTSDTRGAGIRGLMAAQEIAALLSSGFVKKVRRFCPSLGLPIGLLSIKSERVGGGLPPLALHTTVTMSPTAIFGEIFPATSMEREGRAVGLRHCGGALLQFLPSQCSKPGPSSTPPSAQV
jgi:hypothetical protein